MKKNPIIEIPKNILSDNEELLPFNEDILQSKDGTERKSAIKMYVTQTGRMFKVDKNNILKEIHQCHNTGGYMIIMYKSTDNVWRTFPVHRAVLGTFNPLPKEEMDKLTVNHIKGKEKDNNDISNLEWMTPEDNVRDAVKQGLANVLSDNDIVQIMKMANEGYSDKYIAAQVNRSPGRIEIVRTGNDIYGEKIKKLGIQPIKRHYPPLVTDEMIYTIIDLAKRGYSDKYIAAQVNRSPATVANIRAGRSEYRSKLEKLNLDPVKYK